jgi:hypothetical protein
VVFISPLLLLGGDLPRDLLLHGGAQLAPRCVAEPRAQQRADYRQDHDFRLMTMAPESKIFPTMPTGSIGVGGPPGYGSSG